jgi:hypothetical protein
MPSPTDDLRRLLDTCQQTGSMGPWDQLQGAAVNALPRLLDVVEAAEFGGPPADAVAGLRQMGDAFVEIGAAMGLDPLGAAETRNWLYGIAEALVALHAALETDDA